MVSLLGSPIRANIVQFLMQKSRDADPFGSGYHWPHFSTSSSSFFQCGTYGASRWEWGKRLTEIRVSRADIIFPVGDALTK
jgi:hypothetical protein